jgi:hypothetical protein
MSAELPNMSAEPGKTGSLSAQLHAATVRELLRSWHHFNATLFRRALNPPQLGLSPSGSKLGMWLPGTRALLLSESLVMTKPWGVVLEVLKHEMAHQYVHEILGRSDESAHGPAFQAVCARMGIDASAAGLPSSTDSEEEPVDGDRARQLRKIARLLSLAESQNIHEAESAMQEAQRLLLKYNLEVPTTDGRRYSFRHLGQPRGRVDEHLRLVAVVLGRFFFVETIWVSSFEPLTGRQGSVLEVVGRSENLEMSAYVYDFLLHSAERLWLEHKRQHRLTSNRERRTFLSGVMLGFADKLAQQQKGQAQQGLVWVADAELSKYLRNRHPNIRRVYSQGQPRSETRAAGKQAGEKLVLHRPIAGRPATAGAPKLLGPRRP